MLACYGTNMETRRSGLGAGPLKQEHTMCTGSQKSRISSLVVRTKQREIWFLLVQALVKAIKVKLPA